MAGNVNDRIAELKNKLAGAGETPAPAQVAGGDRISQLREKLSGKTIAGAKTKGDEDRIRLENTNTATLDRRIEELERYLKQTEIDLSLPWEKQQKELDELKRQREMARSAQYDAAGAKALADLDAGYLETLDKLLAGAPKDDGVQMQGIADNRSWEEIYAEDEAYLEGLRKELRGGGYDDKEIEQLLDYRQRQKNRENYEAEVAEAVEYAEDHKVGASIKSVGQNLTGGLGYVSLAVQNAHNKLTGDDKPLDYYTPEMLGAAKAQAARETVSKDMGKVGAFLYNTGMSMADSAAIMGMSMLGIPPVVGSVLLGGTAATSAAMEAKKRGVSDDQALMTGLAAGTFEALFEKVSLDKVLSGKVVAGEMRERVVQTLKNIGIQSGVEGSEEFFTSIANTVTDNIINGGLSELNTLKRELMENGYSEAEADKMVSAQWAKSLALDFIGGAISGGVFGGVSTGFKTAKLDAAYAEQYGSNPALVTAAMEVNGESKMAQAAQQRMAEGKQATNAQIRTMAEAVEKSVRQENEESLTYAVSAVATRLDSLGELGDTEKIAEAVVEMVRPTTTASGRAAAQKVLESSTQGQKALRELRGTMKTVDDRLSAAEGKTINPKATDKRTVTGVKYNAETKKMDAIVKKEGGGTETVPLGTSSATMRQMRLADAAAQYGEAGSVMVAGIRDDQDTDTYIRRWNLAYEYGKGGMTKEKALSSEFLRYLRPEQVEMAYEEGAKARAAEGQKKAAEQKAARQGEVKRSEGTVSMEGAVVDGVRYNAVSGAGLSKKQKEAIDVMRLFAKTTGVNVVFYESDVNEQGMRTQANGMYRDGVIYLDIAAGVNGADMTDAAILRTAAHELTHFIQDFSREEYDAIKDFVLGKLTESKGVSVERLIANKVQREAGLTPAEAVDELIADGCEMMLKNESWLQALQETEPGIAKKILNFLKRWIANLRRAFVGVEAQSAEAKAMLANMDELQALWNRGLATAVDTYRRTEKNTAEDGGVVQYEIRAEFAQEVETWNRAGRPESEIFILGSTGPVLQGLGAVENDMYLYGDKIRQILHDHPEMTIKEIKKIPQILEDPALVLKSKTRGNSIVVLGTYRAKNGKPILAAMDLRPTERGLVITDMQKVASAYTKTETKTKTAEENGRDFLQSSEVLFLDKKRAAAVLRPMGIYAPINILRNGYIGSISYSGRYVNISGVPFSSVIGKNKTQNSARAVDSTGRQLSVQQQEYFADSVVRDADGRLKMVYHGSTAVFTEFDLSFMGRHGSAEGQGIYFTDSKTMAEGYQNADGQLMEGYLLIGKPLSDSKLTLTRAEVRKLLAALDPTGDDIVINYDPSGVGYPSRAWYNRAMNAALDMLMDGNDTDTELMGEIANINGDTAPVLRMAREVLGYDGYIVEGKYEDATVYVAFESNQFKNRDNTTPTKSGDVRYSPRETDDGLREDRSGATMGTGKYSLREELQNGKARKEDRESFLRRALEEGYQIIEGKSAAYGYRPVRWESAGENARQIQKELAALGIDAAIIDGEIIWNLNGISSRRSVSQATTVEKKKIVINSDTSMDSKNTAGHEAFHLWYGHTARNAYEDVVTNNLIFSSNEFRNYQSVIAKAYLGGEGDLSDEVQFKKLLEEIFAYISGDIHEGVNDEYLRPMFYDYDAVKAAWNELVSAAGGKRTQRSARDTTAITDREILAHTLDSAAQTQAEKTLLERYRAHAEELRKLEGQITYYRNRLKAMENGTEKMSEAEKTQARNRINSYARLADREETMLRSLAKKDALQAVLKRERSYIEEQGGSVEELKARYEGSLEQKVAELWGQARTWERKYKEAIDNMPMTDKRSEREKMKKLREDIRKKGGRLIRMLETNTDKLHVPEELKVPLSEFLETIVFNGRKASGDLPMEYAARLRTLVAAIGAQMEVETGDGERASAYLDLPQYFVDRVNYHADQAAELLYDAKPHEQVVSRMGIEELQDLDMVLSVLSKSIKGINELHVNKQFVSVEKAAQDTIRTLDGLGQYGVKSKLGERVEGKLSWSNLLPVYAFRKLGKGGTSVFEALQDGWDKLAFNSQRVINFTKETYTAKEAEAWNRELHTVELESEGERVEVQMSAAQIMSLWALSRRKQALGHILRGGIRLEDITFKGKTVRQDLQLHLTPEDIAKITSQLSSRQLEVAKKIQSFMETQGSAWGNEVSMTRHGYNFFGETNYFPIETDSRNHAVKGTEKGGENDLFRLLNLSATKALTRDANNSVIVRNMFDVYTAHMADMAKYNALALPILDAIKWFNYSARSETNEGFIDDKGVHGAIEKAYGKSAEKYVVDFLRDLNGIKEGSGRGEGMARDMMSRYKRAQIAANLRVALLQPTAYVRAMAVMEPKYLAAGFGEKTGLLAAVKEMQSRSGIALWKSMGFFDTDVGRSMREQIRGTQSTYDKVLDKAMLAAEKADELTWAMLWKACKAEVADKQKLQGEKLLDATEKRFREVIYATQVVDSTMTRSGLMRSGSFFDKSVTSFMSEPTVTYNMVMGAVDDVRNDARRIGGKEAIKKHSRKLATAFTTYTVSAIVVGIVETLTDVWRDDDDDETFWEKVRQSAFGEGGVKGFFGGNFVSNLNPLNLIPGVSQVMSMLEGYAPSRMELGGIEQAFKSVQQLWEAIAVRTGIQDAPTEKTYYGNMTPYGLFYNASKAVSYLSGAPLSNVSREVVGIWNKLCEVAGWDQLKQVTYENKKDAANRRIWNAMAEGDDETVLAEKEKLRQSALADGEPQRTAESSATSRIRSIVRDNYWDGEANGTDVERYLQRYGGMSSEEAREQRKEWDCYIETGIKYGDIRKAYETGQISETDVVRMRTTYGGDTAEEAYNKVLWYDWGMENPLYADMGESDAVRYYEHCESAGISARLYYEAVGATKGATKQEHVDYIQSLGLSYSKSKALWLALKNKSWTDSGTPWA